MKIAYVAPGAAGMYCGSCIHDNTLAAGLLELGHDVALVPLYTPIRTDEPAVPSQRIFYGAVNVYLQQLAGLFRRTPRLVERWLDRPALLGAAARLGGSTDPASLGPLTLSVLRGEEGRQRKELERLIDWLGAFRPDVVQLGNGLLIGLAREIRRVVGAPVISGLTGEDLFVDGLAEPWRSRVTAELRRRAADVDAFVAPSRYFAGVMRELLDLPPARLRVVPLGIDLAHFEHAERQADPAAPVRIGYLARICPEKGLDALLDAFRRVVEAVGAERVRLEAGGYVSRRDRAFLDAQRRRVREWGLEEIVTLHGELDGPAKLELLRRIDVMSVPTVYEEPKGLYVLEAWAHGVPVVQPRHGSFPELLETAGGGRLVEPGSPEALAGAIVELVRDGELRRELGRRGRAAVESHFHRRRMAELTIEIYRELVTTAAGGREATA